jgi:hypothetical protein
MKIIKLLFVVILFGYICIGGNINRALADDRINPSSIKWGADDDIAGNKKNIEKLLRQKQRDDFEKYYIHLTGKNADLTNIIQSLSLVNENYNHSAEIVVALNLLSMLDEKDKTIAKHILNCYLQNSYWFIRVKCIEALGLHDEGESDRLAREMLANTDIGLDAKVTIASMILKRGRLYGYTVLREGLTSENKYIREKAIDLMNEYNSYDGQSYDGGNDKIDIKSMRNILSRKTLDGK